MKRIVLTIAMTLGCLSTFATTTQPSHQVATAIVLQDDFDEIQVEEVPEAVTNALGTTYPTAILEKAYKNENKEYKLEISVGDKKEILFIDENGQWIQK